MGSQRLHLHVAEKQFDEGVNFEQRKKAFDDKLGLYTYILFNFSPVFVEDRRRCQRRGIPSKF